MVFKKVIDLNAKNVISVSIDLVCPHLSCSNEVMFMKSFQQIIEGSLFGKFLFFCFLYFLMAIIKFIRDDAPMCIKI